MKNHHSTFSCVKFGTMHVTQTGLVAGCREDKITDSDIFKILYRPGVKSLYADVDMHVCLPPGY